MGQVIELAKFKSMRRRAYLKRYDSHLTKFITRFLDHNLQYSFEAAQYHYMSVKAQANEEAWDYVDFRENLKEAFHEAFGKQIWAECQKLYWFDNRFITQDELMERVISRMILGKTG